MLDAFLELHLALSYNISKSQLALSWFPAYKYTLVYLISVSNKKVMLLNTNKSIVLIPTDNNNNLSESVQDNNTKVYNIQCLVRTTFIALGFIGMVTFYYLWYLVRNRVGFFTGKNAKIVQSYWTDKMCTCQVVLMLEWYQWETDKKKLSRETHRITSNRSLLSK